ncbi:6-pyruvoyl trahydropterin synthase family protein [Rhodothermus bifroesti]|uniref:6-carboxy-5,6,7,8-tetrahydropterin synthase n=1 Tax=Rhodothermus marinus TaxID=29549 RepID=A0A7V2B2G0_RHOMR|nr:6-carboxytetrahydropterin synthase [Rhodothermus bifroesti]
MPTVYVTRRVHFNAAHRLHNPARSETWNQETFGLCNHPNWHGHNYVLEVTVAGEPNAETGFVLNLRDLKAILEQRILSKLDHKNLNLDVDFLQGIIPTTENLVVAIWRELEDALPAGRLYRIRLYETESNYVEYYGD